MTSTASLSPAPCTPPGCSTAPAAPSRPVARPPGSPTADRLAAQAEEVAALGSRLFREPGGLVLTPRPTPAPPCPGPMPTTDDPARIVIRLEATVLGCAWLLDRWGDLRQLLDDGLPWQSHDRLRAVRMLRKQPRDAADDRRVIRIYLDCWAMRRRGGDPLIDRSGPQPARIGKSSCG